MNITYLLNSLAVAIIFIIYRYAQQHNCEQQLEQKIIIKESIFLFITGCIANFFIGEYFYNDFYSKIFPTDKKKPLTEVFTDKPGF